MKKILLFLIMASTAVSGVCGFAADNNPLSVLESDAELVMPKSFVLDDDFVFADKAPGGSSVTWSITRSGSDMSRLIGKNGQYKPDMGAPSAFDCTLSAALSYGGESITRTKTVRSYRTPEYKLCSLIYEKSDGSRISHPQTCSTLVGAEIEKNQNSQTNAVLCAAVYNGDKLCSVSYGVIEKSGVTGLSSPIGEIGKDKTIRLFLWDSITGCRPIDEPVIKNPADENDNRFFKHIIATADNGESAYQVTDGDIGTAYRFNKTYRENTNGTSLFMSHGSGGTMQLMSQKFSEISGKAVFELEFLTTETVGSKGLLYLYNEKGEYALSIILQGANIHTNNESQLIKKEILPYTWYKIKAEADTSRQMADIYIDGILCYSALPFRNQSRGITEMQMFVSPGATPASIYMDNINVTDDGVSVVYEDFSTCEKDGELPGGWSFSPGNGEIKACEYTDSALTLFPQTITLDFGRECAVAGLETIVADSCKIKYKIEASRDNSYFVRIAAHTDEFSSGKVADDFMAVNARYLRFCVVEAENDSGITGNCAIAEMKPSIISSAAEISGGFRDRSHGTSLHLAHPEGCSGNQTVTKSLDNLTGNVTIEYEFLKEGPGSYDGLLYLYNENGNYALSLLLNGDALQTHRDSEILKTGVTENEWHKLRADVSADRQTADIYVDGRLCRKDLPLRNRTEKLSEMRIYLAGSSASASMYVDNLRITNNGAEILFESFSYDGQYLPEQFSPSDGGGTVELAQHEPAAVFENCKNAANYAHISASSSAGGGSFDLRGINDNIAASYNKIGQWISFREANPKIYFSWDETQSVDAVEIFGRITENERVRSAEVYLNEESEAHEILLPQNGKPGVLEFDEPVNVDRMKIKLKGAEGGNQGLSEVRVLCGKEYCKTEYRSADKVIKVPRGYGSEWIVSSDIEPGGDAEFVSARFVYSGNNHYVTALCAFRSDGSIIWTRGTPSDGANAVIGSDVPCQIHDIDGDGTEEVLFCDSSNLIILNGLTGEEKTRHALPHCPKHPGESANDAITVANISGGAYPGDIIVKNRYSDVWAYTSDWELLWHSCKPNGMRAGHLPRPIDIDSDEKDEVLVGFAFMDDDGALINCFDQTEFNTELRTGHVDSFEILSYEKGMSRSDMRFAVSPCGAREFFIIDGYGKKLWESSTKLHYETLICGSFSSKSQGLQIISNPVLNDGDAVGGSEYSPITVYDYDSESCTVSENRVNWGYSSNRYIHKVNITGGLQDYIYQPTNNILTDGEGHARIRLVSDYGDMISLMRLAPYDGFHNDIDGDGTQDITALSYRNGDYYISVYYNKTGKKTADKKGTGCNYSLY